MTAPPNSANAIFRSSKENHSRRRYEQELHRRYYLSSSSSRIAWTVEENPPIAIESDQYDLASDGSVASKRRRGEDGSPILASGSSSTQSRQSQNSSSLQRDIGVMVYPAINSFTAKEPGSVAPALTRMNNFVSYDSNDVYCQSIQGQGKPVVTPESKFVPSVLRLPTSPESTLSPASSSGIEANRSRNPSEETMETNLTRTTADLTLASQRSHFVDKVNLRPEHYRSVTQDCGQINGAYTYPAIPLTFAERKKLSDTLFYLSRDVPNLAESCASILRQARESNEWDLAMAELLTQVVVSLYCGEGDADLDGLRDYLLALGISC